MARIMIVDDSPLARRMLKPILMGAGHEIVFEAANGVEAVRAYREHRPDLVTMDVTMPEEDGMCASKEILSDFPDARIVMVTALRDEHNVLEAHHLGASYYILKPYTKEKVLSVINDVLRSCESRA